MRTLLATTAQSLPEPAEPQAAIDLIGGTPSNWLVTGWFTPDYRPLAEAFAAQLDHHGAPYHLWAKEKLAGWSTTRKPLVVLDTLAAYPGRTVVLCDVDCIINGDVAPVAGVAGDVGICAIARSMQGRKGPRHWLAFETSSRVIVFRPTDAARTFAQRWAKRGGCARCRRSRRRPTTPQTPSSEVRRSVTKDQLKSEAHRFFSEEGLPNPSAYVRSPTLAQSRAAEEDRTP